MSNCFWATDHPPRPPSICMSVGSTWPKSSAPSIEPPNQFRNPRKRMRPSGGLEVAEIFRQHGPAYRDSHRLSRNALRVMRAIEVSFLWQDYADQNLQKIMTLRADEFIRRFLLHVLPSRYVRIRHFGLLANRNRKNTIPLCREILRGGKTVTKEKARQETWQEQLLRICGIDVTRCPVCQKGRMFTIALLLPYRCNSPPELFR